MSRKFTDNEVRAFSKNRNEEKILRDRLDKLNEQFGIYHELTSKQRICLLEESKEIKKTTGGNPTTLAYDEDEFDISKRFIRPWAYSVMDTTYNAAYKDASIPLPKKKNRHQRAKSEIIQRGNNKDQLSLTRSLTNVSRDNFSKSSQKQGSDNQSHHLSIPDSYARNTPQPDVRLSLDHTDGKLTFDPESLRSKSSNATAERHRLALEHLGNHQEGDTMLFSSPDDHSKANSPKSTNECDSLSISFRKLSEVNPNTRIIILPPAYKIDSKAYQQAERERAAMRSKTTLQHTNNAAHKGPDDRSGKLVEIKPNLPPVQIVTKDVQKDQEHIDHADDEHNIKALSFVEHEHELVHAKDVIIFKGRKLTNYIRPEDRYKLDPIVIKRRQNRMDKLAKESMCFLKRVNHENIRVEIAFPRNARKRLLSKLIQEHNECRNKRSLNQDGPMLQRKVHQFMEAMTDYIKQQRLEAEQYEN